LQPTSQRELEFNLHKAWFKLMRVFSWRDNLVRGSPKSIDPNRWVIPWRIFKGKCVLKIVVTRGKVSVDRFYTSLLKVRANPIRKCANNWSARIVKVIRISKAEIGNIETNRSKGVLKGKLLIINY